MAYVDKEKLILDVQRNLIPGTDEHGEVSVQQAERYFLSLINKHTAADVEEVKHGEWQLKSETHRYLEEIDEEFYVECPFCNRVYYVAFDFEDEEMLKYAKEKYPYCNCGAKMDGGDERG